MDQNNNPISDIMMSSSRLYLIILREILSLKPVFWKNETKSKTNESGFCIFQSGEEKQGTKLHIAFLPFREIEGFLRKLSEYIPRLKVIDYSTICKRSKKPDLRMPIEDFDKNIVVAVDSSDMKVTSRGEWIRHK